MNKITQKSIQAFYNGKNAKIGNTKIVSNGYTVEMYLFDNLIAVLCGGDLSITNAGWQSKTTKERLNSLDGVNIQQKNFEWYLNGQKWNGEMTAIN